MLKLSGLLQGFDSFSAFSAVATVCVLGSVLQIEPLLVLSFCFGGIISTTQFFYNKKK
jgi:hypothetical protein